MTAADHAYWLARLIDPEHRAAPFLSAAEAALDRSNRLLDASTVLRPDRAAEREQLRTATQDLQDVTALLVRRIDAAAELTGQTEAVVDAYSREYGDAIQAWQAAVDAVLDGAEQVTP